MSQQLIKCIVERVAYNRRRLRDLLAGKDKDSDQIIIDGGKP